MHCSSLIPVDVYAVWPHMRDCAKGTTPLGDWYLREARRDMPPSKAHVKRLLKDRPRLNVHRLQPPRPSDGVHEQHNSVAAMAREAKRVMMRSVYGMDHDKPHVPNPARWNTRGARPDAVPQPPKPLYAEPKPLFDPEAHAQVVRKYEDMFK